MKVKDLLHALLRAKDMESEVFVHVVDVNPYNGMHELREAGFAVGTYGDDGAFFINAEMIDPDEWRE